MFKIGIVIKNNKKNENNTVSKSGKRQSVLKEQTEMVNII